MTAPRPSKYGAPRVRKLPRDPAFFDLLGELLEHERRAEIERLAVLQRELSLVERAARGYALVDLVLVDESFGLGGRVLLHLQREDGGRIEGRIDTGDLVTLLPRRAEVSRGPMGIVARRTSRELRLVLEDDEPPPPFVHSGRLILELRANDVTYRRAHQALHEVRKLAEASGAPRKRVDVLLGLSPPRSLPPDSRPEHAEDLNVEQRIAVERALAAQDFYLVHGPPGTGKSTVLTEVAVQAVRRGERVLITAASNAAVDHMLELTAARGLRVLRIGHPARVAERLAHHTLSEQVAAHPDHELAAELLSEAYGLRGYARKQRSRGRSAERFAHARQAHTDARALFAEARTLERRAVADILDRAEIVCATLASLATSELDQRMFDLALIDEATQATEPLTLMAFLRARKLVLAGDHQQLPPTVLSSAAQSGGLSLSLFERLLADLGDGIEIKQMLCEQHRMHATIMNFPSQEMYGGLLRAHPQAAQRTLGQLLGNPELDVPPLLLIDTAGKGWDAEVAPGTDSYHNPGEATLLVERLQALLTAGLSPQQIGIIAPYSAQVSLLRDTVANVLGAEVLDSLEIDSVDAFQGREKEAILLSLTRAGAPGQIGFLADLRRINVAITRARRHLLIIGDSATLAAHPFYERLFAYAQTAGAYQSAWELV